MLSVRWFNSVVSRFSWATRTVGRGRRRVTQRKWAPWPNVARSLGVVQLEDRVTPATITWDGGAGTFNWGDAANWVGDVLPGASDDAVIPDLTGTPTISVQQVNFPGGFTVRSVSSAERVALGSLLVTSLTGPSSFSGGLDATASNSVGLGTATVAGGSWSGASVSGTVTNTAALSIGTLGSAVSVASLTNASAGTVTVATAKTLTFSIGLTNQSGGTVLLNQTGDVAGSITNAGALTRTATGTGTVSASLSNTGTVAVTAGTLTVSGIIAQATTSTLTAGTWSTSTGTLDLASAPTLTTIGPAATVVYGGGFAKLSGLSDVQGSFTLSGVNFSTTGALANSGSVVVGGTHTLTVAGAYTQTAGTTALGFNQLFPGGLSASGYTLSGGTLTGFGTVSGSLTNTGGTVAPGASPGILSVSGNYTQGSGGTLAVEVQGTNAAAPDFDQLKVTGTATLAGTLQVTLLNGFVPDKSDTLPFMTFTGIPTGDFTTFSLPQRDGHTLVSLLAATGSYSLTGTSYVVRNTNDSGAYSLRDQLANANAAAGPDYLYFNIPGAGVQTIQPSYVGGGVALPVITDALTIDGWSQGGDTYTGPPLVEIDGTNAYGALGSFGLNIQASNTTVRGLVINRFPNVAGNGFGIGVFNGASNVWIYGNYIGTSADGTTAKGNGQGGIWVGASAGSVRIGTNADGTNDTAERNVISGNGGNGLWLQRAGTVVAGNYIGTNAAGTGRLANDIGVEVEAGNVRVGTDGDGVRDAAEGNLISGNTSYQVSFDGVTSGRLAGNTVGPDVTGVFSLSPTGDGVATFFSTGVVIGTDGSNDAFNANEKNIISGIHDRGVILEGANVLAGNWIGLASDGATPLPNQFGVQVTGTGARVGTNADGVADTAERNVISGNKSAGVLIRGTTGAVVAGNWIGLTADGTAARFNSGDAVAVTNGATGTRVGGGAAGAGNVIVGSTYAVALLGAGVGNTRVQGNRLNTNPTGTLLLGTASGGVYVYQTDLPNTIGTDADGTTDATEGNLITSDSGTGVFIDGAAGTIVAGNRIGTTANGLAALPNDNGVRVQGTATNTTIGGPLAVQRNLLSGNVTAGLYLAGGSGTRVGGNWVGVDATGAAKLPNQYGVIVDVDAVGTVIGGLTGTAGNPAPGTGPGNVISGNRAAGVNLLASATVQGNVIGLAADGATLLGPAANGQSVGIQSGTGADNVLVGGTDVRARNVISGNGAGFYTGGESGWQLFNNYVGTDVTGTLERSNSIGSYFYGLQNLTWGQAGAGNLWVTKDYFGTYSFGDHWTVRGNRFNVTADGSAPLGGGAANALIINSGSDLQFGGTGAGDGNQFGTGLSLTRVAGGSVLGNTFGLTATGTAVLPGVTDGVALQRGTTGVQVGDGTAAGRNWFAFDTGSTYAVSVNGAGTDGNSVRGNWIGTNKAGTAGLGVTGDGVQVTGSATNTTVAGNVIGRFRSAGVSVNGSGTPDFTPAWFRFNGDLTNSGGYGSGGTAVGTIGYGAGRGGTQALSLSRATPGYVVSEDPNGYYAQSAADVSVYGWVNPTSLPAIGERYLIAANGDTQTPDPNYQLSLFRDGAGVLALAFRYHTDSDSGPYSAVASVNVPAGQLPAGAFTHVAVTADGTTVRFYLNGVQVGTAAVADFPVANSSSTPGDPTRLLYIGGAPNSVNLTFNGRLDDVAVTDRALSPAEVAHIAAAAADSLGGAWTRNTTVTGNLIGLLPDGTTRATPVGGLDNSGVVVTDATATTVGGTTAAARNVIAGMAFDGVRLSGPLASGNSVLGNYVGTDFSGLAPVVPADGSNTLWLRGENGGADSAGGSGGTLTGGVTTTAGKVGQGFNFPGTVGDYIRVPSSTILAPTTAVAVELWVKGTAPAGQTYLLAKGPGNATNAAYALDTLSGGLQFYVRTTGVFGVRSPDAGAGVWDNAWHHVVGTYDGSRVRLYVDGVEVGTGTAATGAIDYSGGNTPDLFVGNYPFEPSYPSGNLPFKGQLDEVGVFSRALTAAEVQAVYAQGGRGMAVGNGGSGVRLEAGAHGNTVGGTAAGARNVVSGNQGYGVVLTDAGTSANFVQGNFIGTNAAGTRAVGNLSAGVELDNQASGNTIGGTAAGAGNLVSGNLDRGIQLADLGTVGNVVQGNTVGLGSTGAALPNAGGVAVISGATGNTVGGAAAGAGNVVSGNSGSGVAVSGMAAGLDHAWYADGSGADRGGVTGLTATLAAGAGYGPGKVARGFQLTGAANSYVTLGSPPLSDYDFSFGFWVKTTDGGSARALLSNRTAFSFGNYLSVRMSAAGRVVLEVCEDAAGTGYAVATGTAVVNDGQFHQVTVTRAYGVGLAVYVDGVLDASAAIAPADHALLDGTVPITLGAEPGLNVLTPLTGVIDEVTYFQRAVSAAEARGLATVGNTVQGNRIGTDAAGTAARPNTLEGVLLSEARAVAVRDNTVSGNAGSGVVLTGAAAAGNVVAGNRVGVSAAGAALGNGNEGVELNGEASFNTVGGAAAADANTVSGNAYDGVGLFTGAAGNLIRGNRIGTNLLGTAAVPNGGSGVVVNGAGLGGAADNEVRDNQLAGNAFDGVVVFGPAARTVVAGNRIGTTAAGTAPLANLGNGVSVTGGATDTLVSGNLISGNAGSGVQVTGAGTTGTRLQGNRIGTTADGTGKLANATGVKIDAGATNTVVGGDLTAGEGNLISGNGGDGLFLNTDNGVPAGLLARFQGESSGRDSSGNGRHATILGGAATAYAADRLAGTAFNLDGVNDYISVADVPALHPAAFTAGGWFNFSDVSGTRALFSKPVVTILARSFEVQYSGGILTGWAAGLSVSAAFTPTAGQWYHVALSFGGGTLRLYVNGVQVATGSTTASVLYDARPLLIGVGTIGSLRFAGLIDDFALFGRALSAGEVADIAAGRALGATYVVGNTVGLSSAGTALGNGAAGISLLNTPGSVIGSARTGYGNSVSGNGTGIYVEGSPGTTIQRNYVGTDTTGTAARPNGNDGVRVQDSAGVTIGSTLAAGRNVLSGNSGDGLELAGAGTIDAAVLGNSIGTTAAGTAKLGNTGSGVKLTAGASGNVIGLAGAGNLISGNGLNGIELGGAGTSGNVVQANFIGTDVTGQLALGNVNPGVALSAGASNNTVGGSTAAARNVISGNQQQGVLVRDAGTDGNKVQGNFIGLAADGVTIIGNGLSGSQGYGAGVLVLNGPTNTLVGGLTGTAGSPAPGTGPGNVISGNREYGVWITGVGTTGTIVQGNLIGLTAGGTAAAANGNNGLYSGVGVFTGAANTTIGGSDPRARNVVSGNQNVGIGLWGDVGANQRVTNTLVQNNYVGTNAAGTAAVPNGQPGVAVFGLTTTTQVLGNVVSGNVGGGVYVGDYGSLGANLGVTVQGNRIGTNAAGTAAVPNTVGSGWLGFGVMVEKQSGFTLGGAGAGNVISGNAGPGVLVTGAQAAGTQVVGNRIGTDPSGLGAVGNGGAGVLVTNGATGTVVGGPVGSANTALGNVVAFNSGGGIDVRAVGTTVRLNSAYGNSAFNVQVLTSPPAPTPPGLSSVVVNPTAVRAIGSFTAAASTTYTLDFYRQLPGQTGLQTRTFYASATVTTGAGGAANFDLSLPLGLGQGDYLTVMATGPGGSTTAIGGGVAAAPAIEATLSAPAAVGEGTEVTVTARVVSNNPDAQLLYAWTVTKSNPPSVVNQPFATGTDASLVFTPDDNGVYAVTLTVTDTQNGVVRTVQTFTLAPALVANNVAQVVDLVTPGTLAAPPDTLASGAALTLLARVTDPGPLDTFTYQWFVDGVEQTGATGPTFTRATTLAGVYRISVRVTDPNFGAPVVAEAAHTVTVRGALPAAIIENLPLRSPEGTTVTALGRLAGLYAAGGLTYAWVVTKDNGPYSAGTVAAGGSAQTDFTFTPNDNGVYRVSLTVTDPATGAQSVAPVQTVTVDNVAPTLAVTPPSGPAVVGKAVTLTAAVTDPGTNAFPGVPAHDDQAIVSWTVLPLGTAVPVVIPGGTGPGFQFTPPVPGSYLVVATVTDRDGGMTSSSVPVDVGYRGATVQLGGLPANGGHLTEGTQQTVTASVTNPQPGETYTYTWAVTRAGAGGTVTAGTGGQFTFTPPDNDRYTVTVTAVGSLFSSGTASDTRLADNAAPAPAIVAPAPFPLTGSLAVSEGDTLSLTAAPNDPGAADGPFTYAWTVTGPGLPYPGLVLPSDNRLSVRFPDDGTYTVSVTVADKDNGTLDLNGQPIAGLGTFSRTVVAANIDPTVQIAGDDSAGPTVPRLRAVGTDPGLIDQPALVYRWYVNGNTAAPDGTGPTFDVPANTQTVRLTATDPQGAVGQRVVQVVVGRSEADLIVVSAGGGVTVNGTAVPPPGQPVDAVLALGLGGNDTLDGSASTKPLVFDGGAGNDNVTGGTGDDVLSAGDPNAPVHESNTLVGGGGNDTLYGAGNDSLDSGQGNDTVVPVFSTVVLTDSGGTDTIDLGAVPFGVTLDLTRNQGQTQSVNPGAAVNPSTLQLNGTYERLLGTKLDDTFTAGSSATLYAGAGNDTLTVRGAGTFADAGDGNDTLTADGGAATLYSGAGNDTLTVRGAGTFADAGDGDNTLLADLPPQLPGNPAATLYAGAGNDAVTVRGSGVVVDAGDGNNTLSADLGSQNATLYSGAGNDTVSVRGSGIVVDAGDGSNVLTADPGSQNATLYSGAGNDTLTVRGSGIVVNTGDGNDTLTADGPDAAGNPGSTASTLYAGAGNDQITVRGSGIAVDGGDGNDTVTADPGSSNATLYTAAGNDTVSVRGTGVVADAGDGDNILTADSPAATLYSGAGNDTVTVRGGGVVVSSGDGNDTVTADGPDGTFGQPGYNPGTTAATLYAGAGNDTVTVRGSGVVLNSGDGNDAVTADPGSLASTLYTAAGNDTLTVRGSGIVADAGDGNDLLTADSPAATLYAGAGNDTLTVRGSGVVATGGDGNDTLTADGPDPLTGNPGTTAATLYGAAGNDQITVRGSGVVVSGGDGNDVVTADPGSSNATLYTAAGNDTLTVRGSGIVADAGDGENTLTADSPAATLYSGAGNDTVTVRGSGVVLDSGDGNDTVTADPGTTGATLYTAAGNDTLTVRGSGVVADGGDGNDILTADPGSSSSTLYAGAGNDQVMVRGSGIGVNGGDGNDVLTADPGSSGGTLYGAAGNDTITVRGSGTVADGGDDGDVLVAAGTGTAASLYGSGGNDTLVVATTAGGVRAEGGTGDDTLVANPAAPLAYFAGTPQAVTVPAASGPGVTLVGGTGNDALTLSGGSGGTLSGGDGNDTLTLLGGDHLLAVGGAGNDTLSVAAATTADLYGGLGNDALTASGGSDQNLVGDDGNDTLAVTAGTLVNLYGFAGNDTLTVSGGDQVRAYGLSGNDTVQATAGTRVSLYGGYDADRVTTTDPNAVEVWGGAGNDFLSSAGAADDVLLGEEGDDTYAVGLPAAAVTLTLDEVRKAGSSSAAAADDPGLGTDTIDLRALPGVTLDLSRVNALAPDPAKRQDVITSLPGRLGVYLFGQFENVLGSTTGPNQLTGNTANNLLAGGAGNDSLSGGAGDDTLAGGAGTNTLVGGAGADAYRFTSTAAGTDTVVEAAAGRDLFDFSAQPAGVVIDLRLATNTYAAGARTVTTAASVGGPAAGGLVTGAVGTGFADSLTGTDDANSLAGGAGNDTLVGLNGPDTLDGGSGNDSVDGGQGDDWFVESPGSVDRLTDPAGVNTLDFSQAQAGVTLDLGLTDGVLQTVDQFGNQVGLTGVWQRVLGSGYADVLRAGITSATLTGGGGRDYLVGGAGSDLLQAGVRQAVLLDFDTATTSAERPYSGAERADVLAELQRLYAGFDVQFTLSAAEAAGWAAPFGGQYVTVVFNQGTAGGGSGDIDFRNRSLGGTVSINAVDLITPDSGLVVDGPTVSRLSARLAAHELAHLMGLRHPDSFGSVGNGIYVADRGYSASRFIPAYPGPTAATETPADVMTSPASVGVPLARFTSAVAPVRFGVRDAVKLAFAFTGVTLPEQAAPHATPAAAMPLGTLPGLTVPNTLAAGDLWVGQSLGAGAVAVTGSLAVGGTDVYSFAGKAGEVYTAQLSSRLLGRYRGQSFDTVLAVVDAAGTPITPTGWTGPAVNDDDFESQDSLLLDVTLPADGTYYLRVTAFNDPTTGFDPAASFDNGTDGRYELFVYTVAPGADRGVGSTLVAGAGNDTLVGDRAPDLFVVTAGSGTTVSGGGVGSQTVTAPSAGGLVGGTGVTVVNGQATVAEGTLATFSLANPTGTAPLTFRFAGSRAGLDTAATSANSYSYTPPDGPGTFVVWGRVSNPSGLSTDYALSVAVTNVAPTAVVALTPPATGVTAGTAASFTLSATDKSSIDQAAGFTYTVNWGDGTAAKTYTGASGTTVTYTYTAAGGFTVSVKATDKDGGTTVTAGTLGVTVVSASPVYLSGNDLIVTGTGGNDSIFVNPSGSQLVVVRNGVSYGPYTVPGVVRVSALDGNDTVTVNASVAKSVSLDGGNGNDSLTGGAGNDTLLGGAGNDTLDGGAGNDSLDGADGNNTMWGGAGNDTITALGGNDSATGDAGDDLISLGDGTNTAWGGAGNDTVTTGAGNDVMTGDDGNDSLSSGAGNDTVWAGGGNDTVALGDGNDSVTGDAGDDSITGGDGADTVWGGTGNDRITLGNGSNTVTGDAGDDSITAGDGNNTIWAGAGNDTVVVGNGNDSVTGDDGNDSITAGDGADTVWGGTGNDTITVGTAAGTGSGNKLVGGDDGNDTVAVYGRGNATVYGGTGNDTLSTGVTGTSLVTGDDGNDSVTVTGGSATVTGGTGNDTLTGGAGNDSLDGGDGNDSVSGGAGNDTVSGGTGNDTLDGGVGYLDRLDGGDGNDVLTDPDGAVYVVGGTGNDIFNLTFVNDWSANGAKATVSGGTGDDQINVTSRGTPSSVKPLKLDVSGDDGNDTVVLSGAYLGTVAAHGGNGTSDVLRKGTFTGGSLTWDGFETVQ